MTMPAYGGTGPRWTSSKSQKPMIVMASLSQNGSDGA